MHFLQTIIAYFLGMGFAFIGDKNKKRTKERGIDSTQQ